MSTFIRENFSGLGIVNLVVDSDDEDGDIFKPERVFLDFLILLWIKDVQEKKRM